MRQFLLHSHDLVSVTSVEDRTLIEVNATFLERTGFSRREVIGRTMLDLGVWEDDSEYARIRNELQATGAVRHRSARFKTKQGAFRYASLSATIATFEGELCVISFATDITDHVHSQEELRRSERRFRSYIEHASDGLTVFDSQGVITFVAPSVKRLVGHDPAEVTGRNFREFVHPEDLPPVETALAGFEASLADSLISFRTRHRDGRWIFVEGNATILPASAHEPRQVVFNWRDVTQRKLDEERLRNIERRLRDIISHAPVVVSEFDAQGIMKMAEGNAIPSADVGAEGIGRSMYELFADSREITDALDKVLSGEPISTTAELSGRWFDIWGEPVRDSSGNVSGGVSVSTDITARVEAERNLEQEKEQFRVLIDNASDVIVMLSREGKLLFVSPSAEQQTDYTVDELVGRDAFELIHPDDAPAVTKAAADVFARPDSTFSVRFRFRFKSGEWRRFEAKGKVLPGHPDRMIDQERDITDQEKYETDLANARDAALESSRLKSAFLANTSHEIRTPLNVLLGYMDVIGDHLAELGDDTQREFLDAAARSGKRLIKTIDCILDYYKIEAGGLECNPVVLHLSELVARQVDDLRGLALRKGLELRFIDEVPGTCVMADEYCLSAAMQNLIGNAVKFTERGFVEVRQFRAGGELCLAVRDSGVGIDAKFLPKLFQPFVQEESGFNRKFEGSGLGLALTKRFLAANQARVEVESIKGAGSTFTIHFSAPQQAANGKNAHLKAVAAKPTLPILLVVEDDPDTQTMMRMMLHNLFEVRVASDRDAVRDTLAEEPAIDAVLMDISLKGGEDGLQLTRFLRSQARFRRVPIVAVTAHASSEHQRMALEAGCDAVLTKPVKREQILAALAEARRTAAAGIIEH